MEAVSHALAGAAGGVIAMAVLYPLENVRTRLQVQIEQRKKLITKSNAATSALTSSNGQSPHHSPAISHTAEHIQAEDAVPHYSSTWDCIVRVCEREGWQSLYNGLTSALVGVGVSSAVYFFWYHLLRSYMLRLRARRSMGAVDNLLIAAVAGVLNILCTLPIWVINTRMTLARRGNSSYTSIAHTARTIVAEEGVAGLYKGLVPSLILVSNPAIQFLAYEQLVLLLSRYYRARHRIATTVVSSISTTHANTPTTLPIPPTPLPALSSIDFFMLGAISKAIATVLTYPYQVVKSRMQADKAASDSSLRETAAVLRSIVEREGVGALFNGMGAKMVQTVLNSAFSFVVYEKLAEVMLTALRKAWEAEQKVASVAMHTHT